MISKGDEVMVYLNTPKDAFKGRVTEVNNAAAMDIWYKVKPYGEGVSGGRAFWLRENHVRLLNSMDVLDDTPPPEDDGMDSWDLT